MAGLTPELLRELDLPQFEDAETARRYLEEQAWPEGAVCAHCGSVDRAYKLNGPRSRGGLYHCADCRGHFTVTVKTLFHGTKIPLHKWLQVTAAVEKVPATVAEIGDAIGVTYKTAWRMRGLIRPELLRKNGANFQRQFVYPFLTTYRDTPEHALLHAISMAVPSNIPADRRADICQELALAVLIGEAETKNFQTDWMKSFKKVYKMHPTLYSDISIEAPIPGTDDLRLIDTLAAESMSWE